MASAKTTNSLRQSPARKVLQYDTQGFANSEAVETKPKQLLSIFASNKGAATLWIMLFDGTVVPANATLPIMQGLQVAAGGQTFLDLSDRGGQGLSGLTLANGLVWAGSSTQASLTVDTTASSWVTIRYN